jgi:hypothetical protein
MTSDLIELAELELTNAIVHPDRYNVALRRKFVNDLYTYTDYSVMLSDYIAHQTQYAREYPNDSKYLTQMYLFITRLQQHQGTHGSPNPSLVSMSGTREGFGEP